MPEKPIKEHENASQMCDQEVRHRTLSKIRPDRIREAHSQIPKYAK